MEIDVNLHKPPNALELKTISAGSYSHDHSHSLTNGRQNNSNNNNSHSFNNNHHQAGSLLRSITPPPPTTAGGDGGLTPGCCGILARLLCSNSARGKTATSSGDYNTASPYNGTALFYGGSATANSTTTQQPHHPLYMNLLKKGQQHRRTPQEIYFESRGKSCKKLLKFNGNCNKVSVTNNESFSILKSFTYIPLCTKTIFIE